MKSGDLIYAWQKPDGSLRNRAELVMDYCWWADAVRRPYAFRRTK